MVSPPLQKAPFGLLKGYADPDNFEVAQSKRKKEKTILL